MAVILRLLSTLAVLATAVRSTPVAVPGPDGTIEKRAACTNGPLTRNCWKNGYSVSTDYESFIPPGKTVTYDFEVTNETMAIDGFSRQVLVINKQFPGPVIIADWGDTIVVNVKNSMKDNGTSFHWHGMRQLNTCQMDGANGVTECPIAPGDTKQYSFRAWQYGTTWYHSHYSAQYGDGVQGTIQINGPATANYDIDLGVMPITDWYYSTVYQAALRVTTQGRSPTADNAFINGTMVSQYGGKYHLNTLTKGKKYRLRLINTSVDNHFKVSLDNHNFQVISADFVPIKPFSTHWLFIGIGQRYDVIITANQTVGNYWFRADPQSCLGTNANSGNIKSIFRYAGAAAVNPTSEPEDYFVGCSDPAPANLVPYVKKDVPKDTFVSQSKELQVQFQGGVDANGKNIVQWLVNASAINVAFDKPTLQYVLDGNNQYPTNLNLIDLPNANAWSYWIIGGAFGQFRIPHPIHLHGHDFYVLGTGGGLFNPAVHTAQLNFVNPPRRDVAMMPGGGWLVVAFKTDNPGAWLMHCHIAWHVAEGLSVQFLERKSEIPGALDLGPDWQSTCTKWKQYYATSYYKQSDSGLKA